MGHSELWLVDDRATRHLRRSVSKAVMREGRTDSVRPRLADRLAAKDKSLPRVLDGNSAHPRTPGACCASLQTKRPRAHFSFRRCFQVSVTLRQPKVTAQLPTGGDVSYLIPMRSSAGFCWPCSGIGRMPLTQASRRGGRLAVGSFRTTGRLVPRDYCSDVFLSVWFVLLPVHRQGHILIRNAC